jgi:serine/threonine protein kinase
VFNCCRGYDIACDVLSGLVYLHNHRVVHLDLKSSNILLKDPPGQHPAKYTAKIGDVGLSRIIPVSNEYLSSGSTAAALEGFL